MKEISVAAEFGQNVIVPNVFTPDESSYAITFRKPGPITFPLKAMGKAAEVLDAAIDPRN